MGVVVRTSLHSKLLSALRPPSLAGTSLVERMRSTSFALFGLAAAAGLALVAIFAQPGGPLLAPSPLPQEPSSSIGKAEAVGSGQGSGLLGIGAPAGASLVGGARSGAPVGGGGTAGGGSGGQAQEGGTVGSPHPASSPPAAGDGGGNGGGQPEATPAPAPAPTPAPAPESVPVATPPPPKSHPVRSSAPGHNNTPPGQSVSAGNHPSVQGGEKSSSHGAKGTPPGHAPAKGGHHAAAPPPPPPPPPPAAEPPAAAPSPPPPGNSGRGHGHGHDK